MTRLKSISRKIQEELSNDKQSVKISGVDYSRYFYLLRENQDLLRLNDIKGQILIFSSQEKAEEAFEIAKKQFPNFELLFFPGFDHSPYGGHVASERILFERFYALNKITNNDANLGILVFTTMEGLHIKLPPQKLLEDSFALFEPSDIISPDQLKSQLINMGYQNSITVEEPGTFSHKGEIFDIYPTEGKPIRLHYFDDMIEEIFAIEEGTLKTDRSKPLEKVKIGPSPRMFCQQEFSNNLRAKIPMPTASHKDKFEYRKEILSKLSDGYMFEGYASYVPLFTEHNQSLFDYFKDSKIRLHIFDEFNCLEDWERFYRDLVEEYNYAQEDSSSSQILPNPNFLFYENLINEHDSQKLFINDFNVSVEIETSLEPLEINFTPIQKFLDLDVSIHADKKEYYRSFFKKIASVFKHSGCITFFHSTAASKEEFKHLLEIHEIEKSLIERISFDNFPLKNGFYYDSEKILFLTEGDLFSVKRRKVKEVSQKDLDLFAEQIATLTKGDYVIHSDHGIGKYLGLESLDLKEDAADFLVIEYANKDKVYVPVYKMNLIQKHANAVAEISLDSLRSNKFSALKKRASQSVKKLAFDLLKLQAERQSAQAFSFSPPDHYFKEFELAFEFQETPDQSRAIEHVLEDMQKAQPMDHLVCGDVGFGKTEVAIRAAFKAVLDKKQVAVLVPTTILALQHFNSFKKRLKQFPVNLEFLSRFKSAKETAKIVADLADGKIDIIIGTHKLLSDKVKFNDLGLVIVDEEQRFGVNHKEKLKLLKANVDFLTLTATPIPRTLQLSFLGLRDLSLIKTPPPKRQSIKTYIIKEDALTLQTAIKKELNRGGQVFIVHNKVHDIEEYSAKIRELVPDANIVIGHGQLPEKELEKRMQGFYEGKFQILIATTIIESGIDIPSANTIIIDRADTYGLSQLHQLRGRIGRSDRKAYAYFVIPSDRNLTNVAEKRLKALQTFAEMGSGFNIASCDLEIRGAGDILGAHQSGHIEAIGLELYMELLQEAIRELKGEKQVFNKNIEITSPFASYIPNFYIEDSSERLRQYKRLSNTTSYDQLENIIDELNDVYGPIPEELKNLVVLLKARIILSKCGLKSIQLNSSSISLQFDKAALDKDQTLAGNVVSTFINKPNLYHFSPDYKVLFKSKNQMNQEDFLEFCQKIAEQIVPC